MLNDKQMFKVGCMIVIIIASLFMMTHLRDWIAVILLLWASNIEDNLGK